MTRQSNSRLRWWGIGIVVLVVLFVAVLLFRAFLLSGSSEGETRSQSSSSTKPASSSEPMPTSIAGLDPYEPATPSISTYDCRNSMSDEEYSSFIDRLYQFESISQMQQSDERLALMYPYTTKSFMTTQKGFYETTPITDVTIEVDRGSSTGCTMNSSTEIIAKITPTVTVVQKNDNGSQTVLSGPLTLPSVHFTRWILLEGSWYVDQEKK